MTASMDFIEPSTQKSKTDQEAIHECTSYRRSEAGITARGTKALTLQRSGVANNPRLGIAQEDR
jgi:hypothetical protein